jgi:hypothetical protein
MNEGSYFGFSDDFGSLCTVEWNAPGLTVILDDVGLMQGPQGLPGTPGGPAGPAGPTGPPGTALPLAEDLSIVTSSQTVDVTAYTSVMLNISIAAALTLTLTHIGKGVPVFLRMTNSSSSNSVNFQLVMTDSSGNVLGVRGKVAGGTEVDLANTGFLLNQGSTYYFDGMSGATVTALQIV